MTCIHIYFCRICMEKQRKQKQKKKNSPLYRVFKPKHSAKGPAQVSSAATLPSAKVLALGKDSNVCRVPLPWHSANQTRGGTLARGLCRVSESDLGKVSNFAECLPLDTRQTAGPGWRHVASLPSIRALGKTFAECPYSDTRQSKLCRGNLCRVSFAECYTRQRLCRV